MRSPSCGVRCASALSTQQPHLGCGAAVELQWTSECFLVKSLPQPPDKTRDLDSFKVKHVWSWKRKSLAWRVQEKMSHSTTHGFIARKSRLEISPFPKVLTKAAPKFSLPSFVCHLQALSSSYPPTFFFFQNSVILSPTSLKERENSKYCIYNLIFLFG